MIEGADKVSRFLTGISNPKAAGQFMLSVGAEPTAALEFAITDVNAAPALVLTAEGRPILVLSLLVSDGKVDSIYLMANPEKLASMSRGAGLGASEGA